MVYRLVYGVWAGVWCIGWCMGKHIMQTPAHTYITRHQHTPDTPTFKVAVACLLVVFADVRLVLPKNSTGDLLGEGKMAPTCRMLSAHYPAMDPLRKNLGMTCSKFMRDMFLQVFQFF